MAVEDSLEPTAEEDPDGELSAPALNLPGSPRILPRAEHCISRKLIDPDALKVLYRLGRSGHQAFLVGGAVRDLLLGKHPKDYDISTDARPENVRQLFRNSRIIGRRFRMNQVYFHGGKIIEVSTFRASAEDVGGDSDPVTLSPDNTYGDPQTDAIRRDLTINGLFYDPQSYAVVDYVGGIDDLRAGIVRIIGEPSVRFQQDPVRMIRAVRHSARTGFRIDAQTLEAMKAQKGLIRLCPIARVHEELVRELRSGYAMASVPLLAETGLLDELLPDMARRLRTCPEEERAHFFQTLKRIDERAQSGAEVPISVLFLALYIDSFAEDGLLDAGRPKRTIDDLFRPIGVSKREREDMEQIIATAHQAFQNFGGASKKREVLMRRGCLREALLLIELTANNPDGYACVDFWREEIGRGGHGHGHRHHEPHESQRRDSRGRGRGRPRRRRPAPQTGA